METVRLLTTAMAGAAAMAALHSQVPVIPAQNAFLKISKTGDYEMYYDMKKSGKRIQGLRKAHGMKQTQLAEVLNISLDHLRKIEGGQRGCSVDLLISLSSIFDTSLDFLVLGTGHINVAVREKLQYLIDELTALKETL